MTRTKSILRSQMQTVICTPDDAALLIQGVAQRCGANRLLTGRSLTRYSTTILIQVITLSSSLHSSADSCPRSRPVLATSLLRRGRHHSRPTTGWRSPIATPRGCVPKHRRRAAANAWRALCGTGGCSDGRGSGWTRGPLREQDAHAHAVLVRASDPCVLALPTLDQAGVVRRVRGAAGAPGPAAPPAIRRAGRALDLL